ncbi:hypothetical protein AB0O86_33805 [Streptomyces hirsutus]|uniref:hypothetical protein n=1 Tax=Streptomyces hirsutus TaxID=35620 RepID=UPI00341F4A3C
MADGSSGTGFGLADSGKKMPPRATALDPYKPVIDEILRRTLMASRKQWHTITRIFHRLISLLDRSCLVDQA